MTKEQEMKARSSFTGVSLDELLSDKCLIRLTQQQYQDAIQLVLHLDNKIRVLTDDNQQLMAQISTGDDIRLRRTTNPHRYRTGGDCRQPKTNTHYKRS